MKGRLKKPLALAGDDKLRSKGKPDQANGKIKQVAKMNVVRLDQATKEARLKSSLMNNVSGRYPT